MPTAAEIAAKALEVAQKAQHAAELAQMTANNVITEMRARFDRQDVDSKEFRGAVLGEIRKGNDSFDAFKSDFDGMDRRCKGHDETVFGNPSKNMPGLVETVIRVDAKVDAHDTWISRFLWTWAIVVFMAGGFGWYVVYFYGEDMKRGIFKPSENEWRWRVNKEIRNTVKPDAIKPGTPEPVPN